MVTTNLVIIERSCSELINIDPATNAPAYKIAVKPFLNEVAGLRDKNTVKIVAGAAFIVRGLKDRVDGVPEQGKDSVTGVLD